MSTSNHDNMREAGLEAVLILYGAKSEEALADLLARIMGEKVIEFRETASNRRRSEIS